MVSNSNLHKAKAGKNDEFYTQLPDIENELKHYREYFKGKVVYCNCDDPYESNFFKYFAMNFNFLGLKKLIVTGYSTSPIAYTQLDLFGFNGKKEEEKKAYKIEIEEVYDVDGDGAENLSDIKYLLKTGKGKNKLTLLEGDGDFRSDESIELLKEADIVVTNPPFSLFREYMAQLFEYNKKFIVLSNINVIKYKEIFPLLKDDKMWCGYGFNLSLVYKTTYPNLLPDNRKFVVSKGYDPDDGYIKVPAITRYTNVKIKKRDEKLILFKKYSSKEYKKYDNYDAINVSKVTEIPMDYDGIMAVPITFIDKYNPDQFEIIDLLNRYTVLDSNGRNEEIRQAHSHMCNINGVATFSRILIRKK